MTSANFSRPSPTPRPARGASRRGVRAAAVAGALAGALALTACSDDGGSGDSGSSSPATPRATSGAGSGGGTAGSGSGGDTAGSVTASGELEGSWLTTADGRAVALIITGEQAALFATGGTVCSGTAGKESDMTMIRLTCPSGKKDRTTGMVDSVDGKSLKITWDGAAGGETYTKAEGGQWPSGLPTAGLG